MSTQEERQIALEHHAIELGRRRYANLVKQTRESKQRGESVLRPGEELVEGGLPVLVEQIDELKHAFITGTPMVGAKKWGPALLSMDSALIAAVALQTTINSVFHPTVSSVTNRIGQRLDEERRWLEARQDKTAVKEVMRFTKNWSTRRLKALMKRVQVSDPWPRNTRVHVGALLMAVMVEHLDLFEIVQYPRKGKAINRVQLTEKALAYLNSRHAQESIARPVLPVMLVPPRPWSGPKTGGYLTLEEPVIRKGRESNLVLPLPFFSSPHIAALNAIQATGWKINTAVLGVLSEVWKSGGGYGVPAFRDVQIPPKPADFDTNPEAKKRWKRAACKAYDLHHKNTQARVCFGMKLRMAQEVAAEPRFYIPWSLDYRGRMYPLTNFLHPQGDDSTRALFLFDEALPLGPRGWWWLRIHTANTFGFDKEPFEDRVAWTDERIEQILKIADAPLDHPDLWTEADSPWMFLAACFEVASAVRSGDPTRYHSALPVNIDGTCNGLQHYACLGRDHEAAEYVNLRPLPRPSDLYKKILSLMLVPIKGDAENTDSENHETARWWLEKGGKKGKGLLADGRGPTKPGSMTYSYGVTDYGIMAQLLNGGFVAHHPKPRKAAAYLGAHLTNSIPQVVKSAAEIMDWFRRCVDAVNKAGADVVWTSPTGVPVRVGYRKQRRERVETVLQKIDVRVDTPTRDARKQKSATSPHVIHSYDASHMALVTNRMVSIGCRHFMPIHDSYGAHASRLDDLSYATRVKLVELYTPDRLEEWRQQVSAASGAELPEPPKRGDFDLSEILNAEYAFH